MQPYHDPALSVSPHQYYPFPFLQSLHQRPREPYVASRTARKSGQNARVHPPPHTSQLASIISPLILNRFSRFQRRRNFLENAFPTIYVTARYSNGILVKS